MKNSQPTFADVFGDFTIRKWDHENGFSKGYKIETIEDLDFFEKEEFPN